MSNNIELLILDCSRNNLTELDASNNINFVRLYCNSNNLTELDVRQDTVFWLYFHCCGNKFKFSTLPLLSNNWWQYQYNPQDTINGGSKSCTDTVDLSTEYNVNGHITSYRWFNITTGIEQAITQPTNENGVFAHRRTRR